MCKSELYRQILGTVSQETEISEERILSKAKNAECGLPPTTVVPNPQVYAMPACVAAQYGLGFGAAFGLGGNGGFWG